MASFAMCSRESMYLDGLAEPADYASTPANPSPSVDADHKNTGNSKGKKGNRHKAAKQRRWKKLGLEEEPPSARWVEAEHPFAGEAEVSRATAPASSGNLLDCPTLASANVNPPTSSHVRDPLQLPHPRPQPRGSRAANNTDNTKRANTRRHKNKKNRMADPKEVKVASSVPPHLRFRKSNTPEAQVTKDPKAGPDAKPASGVGAHSQQAYGFTDVPAAVKAKIPDSAYIPPHQRKTASPHPPIPASAYIPPHERKSASPKPGICDSATTAPQQGKNSSAGSRGTHAVASAGFSSVPSGSRTTPEPVNRPPFPERSILKITPECSSLKITPERSDSRRSSNPSVRVAAAPHIPFSKQNNLARRVTNLAQNTGNSAMNETHSKGEAPMGLPKSPPSPPFSAVDPKPVANAVPAADTDNQWGIWVESPAGPSGTLQASRWADASGNAAGGAGRGGRSGRAQPFRGRRTPWPKARDMKPVPVESDGEDGGVACKSDSNGDEWYDVRKLCDWEGKIQPPPVERVECNFTDRHFGARMEAWLNKAPKSWMQETTWHDKKYDILRHLPKGDKNTALEVGQFEAADNAAVVPEYWMPEIIDGKAPQDFWRAHKTSAPAPLSDISLVEQPWWEEYPDDSTVFLKPFEMPNAKVDPNDVLNHNPEIYCSSEIAVTNKKHAAIARQRKLEAKRNRPNVYRGPPLVPVPDRRLKPAVNIYLRPVAPADTAQITEIYNYYVAETIKANEFNPRTTSQLATRIDQTIRQGLPWIVAVLKSNHPNQGKGRQVGFVSETIVGFASIDDHTDPGSMWRFAFELELYVHHEYHRKGVASCLLDRLIDMVSTGYQCRGGYEWRTPSNYLRFGSQRVVKVVNFNYPHENRGRDPQDEDLTGVTKLLEQFNFRRVGHLKNMGAKYSKMVDLTIFQHETSEFIEKELKPSNPL